jgi:hypothetical protein
MSPRTGARLRPLRSLAVALLIGCAGPTAETPAATSGDPASSGGPTARPAASPAASTTQSATPRTSAATPEPSTPPPREWSPLPGAPVAATEVAAAAYEGRVWVIGGLAADGEPLSAVQVYDPATASWARGPDLPSGVHHAAAAVAGGRLHVVGGFLHRFGAAASEPTANVWILDESADRWVAGDPLPEARGAGAAAWDGRRLVYGGGVGPAGVSADVVALNEPGWGSVGALTEPRQHLAATSDGEGRVWFLGGRHVSLAENTGAADMVVGGRVDALGAPLTPRSGLGAFWLGAIGPCAAGGETPGGTVPTVECLDNTGGVVHLPDLGVSRHGVGTAVLDGRVYVLLGGREPGLFVSAAAESIPLD